MCQYSSVAITDGSCLGLRHPMSNSSKKAGERRGWGEERQTYPYVEFDVPVCDSFHIEPHSGDGCDALVELKFI